MPRWRLGGWTEIGAKNTEDGRMNPKRKTETDEMRRQTKFLLQAFYGPNAFFVQLHDYLGHE